MKLKSYSERCETQGEYVIFDYDHMSVKLDDVEILERCTEYDSLDFKSIGKSAIILHKKYIQELFIKRDLSCNLDFEPTTSIELSFNYK